MTARSRTLMKRRDAAAIARLPARSLLAALLLTTTLSVGFASPAAAADRALVIGVGTYADQRLTPQAATADLDTRAIRRALVNPLGYEDRDILLLRDGEATREAILSAFETWLIAGTKEGDRAFLYFSGQGYFQDDADGDEADRLDETLLPFDAQVIDGTGITNVVTDDDIRALALALPGRAVTILVDAGHAGLVSSRANAPAGSAGTRAVSLANTRAIVVEPRVQAQKADGPPLDTFGLGANVAVFTATSGGQAPAVSDQGSVFTLAFVGALNGKQADINANGTISNAEILVYIRQQSDAACEQARPCDVGLTPTLGPPSATGGTPYAGPGGHKTLTADVVLDYFAAGYDGTIVVAQTPLSPVRVGTRDIRFQVTSRAGGNLILLDISDTGRLVQLFPNQFVRQSGREGVVLAGSTITVPDDYYGIQFSATEPSSGTLIALVTHEKIDLPAPVKTRKIEVIPRDQAHETYLPAIAGALGRPVDTGAATPTRALDWSVATLRYEIVP